MREQFETLPDIANHITESTAIYNEKFNWYECYNDNMGYNHEKFINGAWYAFQKQQQKIDEKGKLINAILLRVHVAYMNSDKSSIETLSNEIEELLK